MLAEEVELDMLLQQEEEMVDQGVVVKEVQKTFLHKEQ